MRRRNVNLESRIVGLCSLSGVRVRRTLCLYPLEPNLSPVRVDTSRTEKAAFAVAGLANDGIKYDARALHLLHFSSSFVNDLRYALENCVGSSAIRNEFRVPQQAAVHIGFVTRGANGVEVFYSNQFAW